MVVGLVRADSGSIHLNDIDITALPMYERARMGIGYLAQEASIFRQLSVMDNLMGILEFSEKSLIKRREKADELLESLSLTHVASSLGVSLSGGERRRAEIARALATDPAFLLLDEPFAGVDPIAVADIQGIIAALRRDRGIGILITDHNVRETLKITDRTYVMNKGRILVSGGVEEIISNQEAKRIYLGEDFQM
jgi:lipopolysaccharide export system ATP-binding protein